MIIDLKNVSPLEQSESREDALEMKFPKKRKFSVIPNQNSGLVSAVLSGCPVVRETVSAVNRSFWVGLERHFCLNITVRTGCFVHFPWSAEIRISSEISVIKSHIFFTFCLFFS
jgi:hypothetical protein